MNLVAASMLKCELKRVSVENETKSTMSVNCYRYCTAVTVLRIATYFPCVMVLRDRDPVLDIR